MVSPRMVPSQVWSSSKVWWASAVRPGSVASSLMPGTNRTQRERPMTWTVAAAMPMTGDPPAEPAAGDAAEEDAGRGEQGGADDEHEEPGR